MQAGPQSMEAPAHGAQAETDNCNKKKGWRACSSRHDTKEFKREAKSSLPLVDVADCQLLTQDQDAEKRKNLAWVFQSSLLQEAHRPSILFRKKYANATGFGVNLPRNGQLILL